MQRIAVVGSGVAGLLAAHVCAASARVTLYESAERLGGHADTHDVREGDRTLAIDTGFIVHNRRTYPVLTRLFDELGVRTQESEMSMSVSDDGTGLEWAGALGLAGLLPSGAHMRNADYLRMLGQVPRFHRAARRLLAEIGPAADQTLAEFLRANRFPAYFVRHFAEPLVAAVWSCDPALAGQYPARYLFRFLAHHGMLSVSGSPTWRTVTGGSREYVARVAGRLQEVRTACPVVEVREHAGGVGVRDGWGESREYDGVVVATHPRQALAILATPTRAQREVLGALTYSPNTALLHTDTSLLPRQRRAWASWNFRRPSSGGSVLVTYDLTRLQRLDTGVRYLVTLGGEGLVDEAKVLGRREYEHPLYTPRSVAAQRRLPEIGTDRVVFAGAYHGWGFHEDGARSGLEAARRLGFDWPVPEPARPRVYATTVRHVRRTPYRRSFVHRSHLWLVDVDALPHRTGPRAWLRRTVLGSVEARDHLGDPGLPLRDNLARFLARHGVELGGAGVLLAAHPRALGFCFNPISVWWCTAPDGSPLATVVEVHNTYGDRHAYLLPPGGEVAKEMYVSPFHGTDGTYHVTAPPPGGRIDVAVSLVTGDGARFSASLRGHAMEGAGLGAGLRAALAGPLDAVRIRGHGLVLWACGLPVRPRPVHHQEGVR